jgi:hypothetical protein
MPPEAQDSERPKSGKNTRRTQRKEEMSREKKLRSSPLFSEHLRVFILWLKA